jgi:hypothetical protein
MKKKELLCFHIGMEGSDWDFGCLLVYFYYSKLSTALANGKKRIGLGDQSD